MAVIEIVGGVILLVVSVAIFARLCAMLRTLA